MTCTSGNRLATFNSETVEYDADGNMVTGPLAGEMTTYIYDSRNRLLTSGNLSYQYDAENNRTAVNDQQSGTRTDYIINPNTVLSQVLAASDANGSTWYVYGLGLIGQENPDGSYQTYHYDLRGSTVALTDQTGKVTDRFQYGPYGEMVRHEGDTVTPFQYCGQYGVMTDTNGLCYMRARYYNPEIRRFVNQDVLIGSIDDSQSLNRFAYVNGEPINSIDPFGLFSFKSTFNKATNIGKILVTKAKNAGSKLVVQGKQAVKKVVNWVTSPSTLRTAKKVTAITGGVAAVAALVVTAPAAVTFISGVTVLSTAGSILATVGLIAQDKAPLNRDKVKKYGADLALDIVPAGLGVAVRPTKALTVLAKERHGLKAAAQKVLASCSFAIGLQEIVVKAKEPAAKSKKPYK